jgi:hypothetical protein
MDFSEAPALEECEDTVRFSHWVVRDLLKIFGFCYPGLFSVVWEWGRASES